MANEKQPKIVIDLGFAKLEVEQNTDPNYREVFVGLVSESGDYQDLAVIGQEYEYDKDLNVVFKPGVSVKVYSDECNEDFTHDFSIGLYEGFTEEPEVPKNQTSSLVQSAEDAFVELGEQDAGRNGVAKEAVERE